LLCGDAWRMSAGEGEAGVRPDQVASSQRLAPFRSRSPTQFKALSGGVVGTVK
jgi:hypothetical protein